MAVIPFKQTITLHKADASDDWGEYTTLPPITLKCRVDETTSVVKNQIGEEVVSGMTVWLDKLADVSYDDTIEYTNELGVTVKRKPIKIEPVRGINGKPIFTFVYC